MSFMWVLTSPAVRSPAMPRSRSHSLRASLARFLARFYLAKAFNQPLNNWNTSQVTDMSYMWVLTSTDWPSRAPPP